MLVVRFLPCCFVRLRSCSPEVDFLCTMPRDPMVSTHTHTHTLSLFLSLSLSLSHILVFDWMVLDSGINSRAYCQGIHTVVFNHIYIHVHVYTIVQGGEGGLCNLFSQTLSWPLRGGLSGQGVLSPTFISLCVAQRGSWVLTRLDLSHCCTVFQCGGETRRKEACQTHALH